MHIIADTHTHSLACDHAYSTISENIAAALAKGLLFLALTEHAPMLTGAPTDFYFTNLRSLPCEMQGVTLLKGAEVNIIDRTGALDLREDILDGLDWVIASLHKPVFAPATAKEHTEAYLAIAENPLVDVIGHCGDSRYPFDERTVIRAFARCGKIVEINSHSLSFRPGSAENCPRIARLCAEEGVPIVVSSDAHFHTEIGNFADAVEFLSAMDFPQELILNVDEHRFAAAAMQRASQKTKIHLAQKYGLSGVDGKAD